MRATRKAFNQLKEKENFLLEVLNHYKNGDYGEKRVARMEKLYETIKGKRESFQANYVTEMWEREEREKEYNLTRCSFCGKHKDDVDQLVSGPNDVYICCECVQFAVSICNNTVDEMDTED